MIKIRRQQCRNERGSVSLWMASTALTLITVAGIGVDFTGSVHVQQRARGIAAQAARTGAEQVDAAAVQGSAPAVNVTAARAAAQGYLTTAGVRGNVTVNGSSIRVTVRDTYETKFLSIVGINRMKTSGRASAQLIRTAGGEEW